MLSDDHVTSETTRFESGAEPILHTIDQRIKSKPLQNVQQYFPYLPYCGFAAHFHR